MSQSFTITTKLGTVTEVHPSADSPFTLPERHPAWHTDATVRTLDLSHPKRQQLYPVEALGLNKDGQVVPNPVPTFRGIPFEEPGPEASAEEQLEFVRSWILGHPLVETDNKAFYNLLVELAQLARNYNAGLYRLRRLHYFELSEKGTHCGPLPPRNPHGEHDDPEPKHPEKFAEQVRNGEADWKLATARLDEYIAGEHHGIRIATADMVEVNGYIVSMRIILKPTPGVTQGLNVVRSESIIERAGGSSSQIPISSKLSSSSSSSPSNPP